MILKVGKIRILNFIPRPKPEILFTTTNISDNNVQSVFYLTNLGSYLFRILAIN